MNRIQITTDNRIRLSLHCLDPETLTALQREFTHRNPNRAKLEKQIEGAKFNRTKPALRYALEAKLKQEPATEPTWRINGDEISFARGGKERLFALLEDAGYFIDEIDNRNDGSLPRPNARYTGELRSYQEDILRNAMASECGIARAPTGSGKTENIIGLICEANVPSLVIVHEGGLLMQWIGRIRKSTDVRDVGVIGDGQFNPRSITVGMQQSLVRRIDSIRGLFGFVACDEAHLFAASTFIKVVDELPTKYRFGFTADERRKDKKEYLLYDTIGPRFAEVKEDELIEEGHILDVEVRLVPTEFEREWWNEMPPQSRGTEMNRLIHEMAEDPARNEIIIQIATWAAREGHQTLVMAHHVDHCRRLLADIAARDPRVGLLIGDDDANYTRSIAGLLRGDIRIGVGTYKKMGTGIDVKALSCGIAATPIHLNRGFQKQVKGRFCRTTDGKTDSALYVLWDREIFGLAPVENFKRWARRCVVRDDDRWIDAKEFLKREKAES